MPRRISQTDPLPVAGNAVAAAAPQLTRPADATAYASGDLVANSTTPASVVPLAFAAGRAPGVSLHVRRARVKKSGTGVTGAAFRVHLYTAPPTVANGDNGAFSTSGAAGYLGYLDVTAMTAFTDGAAGHGAPNVGTELTAVPDGTTVYGLLEARGAYTPSISETFDVSLEVLRN